jgi:hypothetical protein
MRSTTKWVIGMAISAIVGLGTCTVTWGRAVAADYSAHKASDSADHQAIIDISSRLERIDSKLDRLLERR